MKIGDDGVFMALEAAGLKGDTVGSGLCVGGGGAGLDEPVASER